MFVEQGMVLDPSIGSFKIPPISLSTFDVVCVIIWVPVYDSILVPLARRFTSSERGFTTLQRVGIGLLIFILAISAAAVLEIQRLAIARDPRAVGL
jgi:peptide/histidine transporter 3/4